MQQEDVNVSESVNAHVTHETPVGQMARVVVTSEAGLFKNGQHYPKGTILTMPFETAQNFAKIGDVQNAPEGA